MSLSVQAMSHGDMAFISQIHISFIIKACLIKACTYITATPLNTTINLYTRKSVVSEKTKMIYSLTETNVNSCESVIFFQIWNLYASSFQFEVKAKIETNALVIYRDVFTIITVALISGHSNTICVLLWCICLLRPTTITCQCQWNIRLRLDHSKIVKNASNMWQHSQLTLGQSSEI